MSLKQTPLHDEHVRLGARMVDFGGWHMPVQYAGILDEHATVRTALGVFDISHMGQFFVRGAGALEWLNRMLTNNVARLEVGEGQYTFLLNDAGGVIDDLIIYRLSGDSWLLVVNAAKIDEDFAWMESHLADGVELENHSATWCGIAIQGPRAAQLFDAFFGGKHSRPARNHLVAIEIDGLPYYICRTGYTGEDGFEVFCPAERAVKSWNDVLKRGEQFGIKPCGLGARDTLRLEMCYPLNGSDLAPDRTPLEAGLSIFVDLNKPDFIGRAVLDQQKSAGIPRRLVPLKVVGAAPPLRAHYAVFKGGQQVGELCSGTLSPTLKTGIGLAYVPSEHARIGEEFDIDIRGRRFPARIEKKPFYRPQPSDQ
ncbi:MAG: glycine cleavage system aminomethyltransferase GcvT [Chthoniobacteraceae bacterium]